MKEKPCKICGKIFLPYCPSNVICPSNHYIPCPICGNLMLWNSTRELEPCSKQCRKERTKRNNIFKYGVEHPMQNKEVQNRHKQAMLDKYGVESPLQSDEIKQKAIATNREKFGADWALGSKEIKKRSEETMKRRYGAATTLESPILRKKVEQTCIERYGVPHVFQSEEVKQKITNSNFLRYGVANPMQNPEIYNKMKETKKSNHGGQYWTEEMEQAAKKTSLEKCGFDDPSKSPEMKEKIKQILISKYGENYGSYLTRNSNPDVISNINRTFMSKLKERGIEAEFEFTGISRYRYDIVIPQQKVLIEIDPTYTHNCIGNHWVSEGLDPDYHLNKTRAAVSAGYQCIHIFDWDDWNRIIDLVSNKQIVGARKCNIYKLDPKVASNFIEEYHLQGTVKGQILCLGLVMNGELLQVMTFGKPMYNKDYYSELLRLCTKRGYIVAGGASKLFRFATKNLDVDEIISYCDLSKFTGRVYEKMGMKFKESIGPQETWSKGDSRITTNLLNQRGFNQLFGTDYGEETSNSELMIQDGWLPVYDCGQAVYTYSSEDD